MFTLLAYAAEQSGGTESIQNVFLRPPSLFNLLDLTLTLGIVYVLWRFRRRILDRVVTPRQYERFSGRLDAFERQLVEDRTQIDARFDALEATMQKRAFEDRDFRRVLIEAGDTQLKTIHKTAHHVETLIRRIDYVFRLMEKVRCVRENGMDVLEECVRETTKEPEEDTNDPT